MCHNRLSGAVLPFRGKKRERKREKEREREEDGREGRDCESRFDADLLLNGVPLMGLFM